MLTREQREDPSHRERRIDVFRVVSLDRPDAHADRFRESADAAEPVGKVPDGTRQLARAPERHRGHEGPHTSFPDSHCDAIMRRRGANCQRATEMVTRTMDSDVFRLPEGSIRQVLDRTAIVVDGDAKR